MEEFRDRVWYGMLDADKCVRYYDCLAWRFHRRDQTTKIFLATMSSGTVAGWAIWSDSENFPFFTIFWKLLSGCSALLAAALPILNYSKKVEVASRLKAEFADILREYELLWINVDDLSKKELQTELKKIWQKESKLSSLEHNLPGDDKKIARRCQQEVIQARGLNQ